MQMKRFYRTEKFMKISLHRKKAFSSLYLLREILRKKSILKRAYLGASDTFYDYLLTLMFTP